jgi:hypothetical protein
MAVALALFLSTLQTQVNGSHSPYATDVGEIQNALPRWGTIHWTGYPVYTFLGSTFVTLFRWIGVLPAASTSLFSTLWGVASVGLLVFLLQELDVSGPLAALGGLIAAVSTSIWLDASLAEVHTLTILFTLATLLFAMRFGRSGQRRDLLLLALSFSQGVAHQRAVLFLAPAVLVLVATRWRAIWGGFLPALGLALLAPLTYLYLPLRVHQGATWTFGSPGSWQQVMVMLFDNRAERIVSYPAEIGEWISRLIQAFDVTAIDLPPLLLALGLIGLLILLFENRRRETVALTLAWIPYLLLTAVIWIGRVGDAQLAAHLPVTVLAAVGLALLADRSRQLGQWAPILAGTALAISLVVLAVLHRPVVLEVTRDPGAQPVIETAQQVASPPEDRPTTLMALWGRDFWALAYTQQYEHKLEGLDIVDHNADFGAILSAGHRLLTLSDTFYQRPLSWWEGNLGRLYLSSAAHGVIEIARQPPVELSQVPPGPEMDMGDGLWIRSAQLAWKDEHSLLLTVYWQAKSETELDYSIAAHLVATAPPQGAEDVLAQDDRTHPVYGWYPTSHWAEGEIVRTDHLLTAPQDSVGVAVRVVLYRVDEAGNYVNSPWLSLPLPTR